MKVQPERILLIQLQHLGDVVLTTPAIRATRRAFPDAQIDFLTGGAGAQALAGNPHLDNVLVKPSMRELRRIEYDAVVDMHSVPPTAWATFATRATLRVGIRGRGPRNLAYTHLMDRENSPVYMARQKMRLLTVFGITPDPLDVKLDVTVTERERQYARETLASLAHPIVAISPVAKHEFKQWGAERWAATGDAIADSGASILVTSGPGEEEQARAVVERMRHQALWQYGRITVRGLAALYEQCVMWVGNDGGPKHFAVAAGIPTVTVYRHQHGRIWSDEADPTQVVVNSGQPALDSISVDDVVRPALEMLR